MISFCKERGICVVLFTSGVKIRQKLSNSEVDFLVKEIENRYWPWVLEGLDYEKYQKIIAKEKAIINHYNNLLFSELSREDISRLEYLGLDKIVFDLQAWNSKVMEDLMGLEHIWDYVYQSIIRASRSKIMVDVHYIPMKVNYKELPEIVEMLNCLKNVNLSILNFVPQGRGRDNKNKLMLNDEEMTEFIQIYQKCKEQFKGNIRVGVPLIQEDSHRCVAGMSKMVIKYDGTVLPCPAFKDFDLDTLKKMVSKLIIFMMICQK